MSGLEKVIISALPQIPNHDTCALPSVSYHEIWEMPLRVWLCPTIAGSDHFRHFWVETALHHVFVQPCTSDADCTP